MKKTISVKYLKWSFLIVALSTIFTFFITDGWSYHELYLPSDKFSYIQLYPDYTWFLILLTSFISFTLIEFVRFKKTNVKILHYSRWIAFFSIILVAIISVSTLFEYYSNIAEFFSILDYSDRSIIYRYSISKLAISAILITTGMIIVNISNARNSKTNSPPQVA